MTREKLIPRDCQIEGAEAAYKNLINGGKGIVVIPTGAGKSLCFSLLAERLNEDILIVCHTQGLVSQNYQAALDMGIEDCGIYCASLNRKDIAKVTFCTVKSAKNNIERFKHFNYVCIDECDVSYPTGGQSEYAKFFKLIDIKAYVGFTATPLITKSYADGPMIKVITRQRPNNFKKIIYHYPISKVLENKYWCDLNYVSYVFDNDLLKLNSTGREYTDVSVKKALTKYSVQNNAYILIKKIRQERPNEQILLFCHSLEDAEIFKRNLKGSEIISYKTLGKEREKILDGFRDGNIPILINLNVLKQGANFPKLENIIIARAFGSIKDWLQVVGRGVRKSPGKEVCNIIDFCGNIQNYGRVEDIDIKKEKNGKYQLYSGDVQISGIYKNSINKRYENVLLDFNCKFKGKPLKAIPLGYLKWIATSIKDCQPEIKKYLG